MHTRANAATESQETPSDFELIAAINGGDASAFETLYWRHRDWVLHLATRFTGDSDAALDVLQDTFLYVLKKFPGFQLTCQFKTFLYLPVRNLSIAARQKAKRYELNAEGTLESLQAPPASDTGSPDADLPHVLACLPEHQREVLMLRFVDDLNLQEIAAAMDIPLGTVKSRLHLALQTLREDPRTKEFFDQ